MGQISRACKSGFTLIELSIVLVIIGLVVGGILAGREMIQAATYRALIKEQEQIAVGVKVFKLKYNCLPGDCANATSFFGAAADCTGAVSLDGTGTCNGSGDGMINEPIGGDPFWYNGGEHLYAAHHLKLANMVSLTLDTPGSTVVKWSGLTKWVPGGNVLGSNAVQGIGFEIVPIYQELVGTTASTDFWYCGNYPARVHNIFMGGAGAQTGPVGQNNAAIDGAYLLSGMDGYSIDSKIDDGRPGSGYVQSHYFSSTNGLITISVPCSPTYSREIEYTRTTVRAPGALVFMTKF